MLPASRPCALQHLVWRQVPCTQAGVCDVCFCVLRNLMEDDDEEEEEEEEEEDGGGGDDVIIIVVALSSSRCAAALSVVCVPAFLLTRQSV